LKEDAVFGVKESLIADFPQIDDPLGRNQLGMPIHLSQLNGISFLRRELNGAARAGDRASYQCRPAQAFQPSSRSGRLFERMCGS